MSEENSSPITDAQSNTSRYSSGTRSSRLRIVSRILVGISHSFSGRTGFQEPFFSTMTPSSIISFMSSMENRGLPSPSW